MQRELLKFVKWSIPLYSKRLLLSLGNHINNILSNYSKITESAINGNRYHEELKIIQNNNFETKVGKFNILNYYEVIQNFIHFCS